MPVSITKGTLNSECIQTMVKKAFGCQAETMVELTEGFFNIAYKIHVNHQDVILKIAPADDIAVMTHEKNIMYSEVDAMRKVGEQTQVPIPKILYYDDSRTICDRPYFFMEVLEGCSFSSCMEQFSENEKYDIYVEVGKYTKELNQLTNDTFGYYCQKDEQGKNWFAVFRSMIEDTYNDAERKSIHIPVERKQVLSLLDADKSIFEEVTQPKFVHWDIWAGNVFVHDKKVTGLIDFERCLWADELMEVGFRTYGYEQGFFDGYGIKELTKNQERRAKWYDIYLFLIASLEYEYRKYDTMAGYHWACDMLVNWVKELEKTIER